MTTSFLSPWGVTVTLLSRSKRTPRSPQKGQVNIYISFQYASPISGQPSLALHLLLRMVVRVQTSSSIFPNRVLNGQRFELVNRAFDEILPSLDRTNEKATYQWSFVVVLCVFRRGNR